MSDRTSIVTTLLKIVGVFFEKNENFPKRLKLKIIKKNSIPITFIQQT